MKKVKTLFIVFIAILLTFTSCFFIDEQDRKPTNQPNTKWVSEDGKVSFTVGYGEPTRGTITVDDECIDILFFFELERGHGLRIYSWKAVQEEGQPISKDTQYEHWTCSFTSMESFVATVNETTFFEVEQEITFFRVDE